MSHHWAAVVSCWCALASACRLQVSLSCAVVLPDPVATILSSSSLHRLAGLPCGVFLSYGLHVVIREVHRSSLWRLICPAQDHFILFTLLIISMTFVPLPDTDIGLHIIVCDVEHTSFHFGLRGRKFVLCLFGQCPGICPIYHSWQHTGVVHIYLQADGKVAFEDTPVFGVSRPAAMRLRCISLSWFFSLRL